MFDLINSIIYIAQVNLTVTCKKLLSAFLIFNFTRVSCQSSCVLDTLI